MSSPPNNLRLTSASHLCVDHRPLTAPVIAADGLYKRDVFRKPSVPGLLSLTRQASPTPLP
jgi:hypothetical protein